MRAEWMAAVGLLLVVALAGRAGAAEPDAILAALRQSYEQTQDLSVRFLQVSHLAAAGTDRESEGRAVFRKGGKMRWTYEGDDPQELVSDGRTLWVHQVRDRTVLRQDLAAIPPESRLALDLLEGFADVARTFAVRSCGALCVEFVPREPRPDVSRVLVEVAESLADVRSVTTEDALGNRTRLELRDARRNGGVPDSAFAFTPPAEAQVVEMGGKGH